MAPGDGLVNLYLVALFPGPFWPQDFPGRRAGGRIDCCLGGVPRALRTVSEPPDRGKYDENLEVSGSS